MTSEIARKRPMYELAFIVGAVVLAVGGVVAGVLFAVLRIPGEEIASIDVVPGEPFALDAVATGAPLRVWMAIDCEFCANAVATGELEVRTGGRVVASHRFDEGGARLFADDQSGGRMSHRGDLLFSVPAQPAGTPMTLNGTITLPPASAGVTVWPPENFGERTATRVKLHAFRVFLAP